MDMTPVQWVLIVLLVLLIAVGVYMLTRKPAAREDRNADDGQISTDYAEGGDHVAAGDAGTTPSAPLFDQEADAAVAGSSVEEEPIEAPVWAEDEALGQDTATGGDVEIVEEEPVISATEDVESTDQVDAHADSAELVDRGDREQMSYGDTQVEDFASETVYAEAPAGDYATDTSGDSHENADVVADPAAFVVDDHDDVPDDAAAAGFVGASGATAMGSQLTSDDGVADHSAGDVDADLRRTAADETRAEANSHDEHLGHSQGHRETQNPGPQDEDEEVTQSHPEQGHPGGNSQSDGEASYATPATQTEGSENPGPEDGEGTDEDEAADLGHPGPESQRGDEATYAVGTAGASAMAVAATTGKDGEDAHRDGVAVDGEAPDTVVVDEVLVEEVVIVDGSLTGETVQDDPQSSDGSTDIAEHPSAQDVAHDESVADEPAGQPDSLIEASPYGAGSALPGDDGQGPVGYEIKGNAGSMLFHTPESPSYAECAPGVFFENEAAARAAGFAHWDRKRR